MDGHLFFLAHLAHLAHLKLLLSMRHQYPIELDCEEGTILKLNLRKIA